MTAHVPASILARLLTLAKQRGDDYSLLLNRFALERLLLRLSASPHANRSLLKGALLFALWYDIPQRATPTYWALATTTKPTWSPLSAKLP